MKHLGEIAKNPKEFNPQISDDLSRVILKCLEKEKENRYQSTNKILSELDRMEKGLPTTERIEAKIKPLTSKEITITKDSRTMTGLWSCLSMPRKLDPIVRQLQSDGYRDGRENMKNR